MALKSFKKDLKVSLEIIEEKLSIYKVENVKLIVSKMRKLKKAEFEVQQD